MFSLTLGPAQWTFTPIPMSLVPDAIPSPGQTLARVPIFAGLSEAELAFLSQRTASRRFLRADSSRAKLYSPGEPRTGLYVVESGHVRIFKC